MVVGAGPATTTQECRSIAYRTGYESRPGAAQSRRRSR